MWMQKLLKINVHRRDAYRTNAYTDNARKDESQHKQNSHKKLFFSKIELIFLRVNFGLCDFWLLIIYPIEGCQSKECISSKSKEENSS